MRLGGEAQEALGLGTCHAECVEMSQNEPPLEFLSALSLPHSEGLALFTSQVQGKVDMGGHTYWNQRVNLITLKEERVWLLSSREA